jgi:hypothetical protein
VTALRLGGISWNDDARSWSLASFLAGLLGAACAGVIIASQADPSQLNWPLILVPAVAVPLPVLVPRPGIRVTAAIVMTGWCWLTGLSIGLFFAPCLLLMIVAARRQDA